MLDADRQDAATAFPNESPVRHIAQFLSEDTGREFCSERLIVRVEASERLTVRGEARASRISTRWPVYFTRLACVLFFGFLNGADARAQGTRDQRIAAADAAWGDLDFARARDLLTLALDPKAGPADATWANGVQLLAQILIEGRRPAVADAWLRWGFRVSRSLPIDSLSFTPDVVSAALEARSAVGARTPGDSVTNTSWEWPSVTTADSVGRLQVAPMNSTATIVVLVRGPRGPVGVSVGQTVALPAGTYQIQATAEGYLTARVNREVLPGVTTVLAFDLRPVPRLVARPDTVTATLPAGVAAGMQERLVKLWVHRYNVPVSCVSAFQLGSEGLVATSYRAIRGATQLEPYVFGGRRADGVVVAAYDVAKDLALLRFSADEMDSVTITQTPSATAWAVGFVGCESVRVIRVGVKASGGNPLLHVAESLPAENVGAPLIDQNGSLIGVIVRPDSAVSAADLPALLSVARANVLRGRLTAVEDVARTEKHVSGSLLIRTTVKGATVRVLPLDSWQWAEAAREGTAPMQFNGPMGRYVVELVLGTRVVGESVLAVSAKGTTSLAIESRPGPAARSTTPVPVIGNLTLSALSAGSSHTCGLDGAGKAYCWGYNLYGQLGNGSTLTSSTALPVSGGLTFKAVSAGDLHTCGITSSGAAYCWGRNQGGALGSGTTLDRPVPIPVSGARTFLAIAAGHRHSCGVTTDGAAYCWGLNNEGQLGDSSISPSSAPVPVSGGLRFLGVSVGASHTCGLVENRSVFCWGYNHYGQLGSASTTNSTTPVRAVGRLTFSAVSAGELFTCGITTGGAAYCWGLGSGQLGNLSSGGRAPVSGGLTFKALTAGGAHTCGVAEGGAGYCWGNNAEGQLGGGGSDIGGDYSAPLPIVGGLTLKTLSAGKSHTCGLTAEGRAFCWGLNRYGQLGNHVGRPSAIP